MEEQTKSKVIRQKIKVTRKWKKLATKANLLTKT